MTNSVYIHVRKPITSKCKPTVKYVLFFISQSLSSLVYKNVIVRNMLIWTSYLFFWNSFQLFFKVQDHGISRPVCWISVGAGSVYSACRMCLYLCFRTKPVCCRYVENHTWGDFSLFCLDSMRSTISTKSSQLCRDKVSLSDSPRMSSYIMQCVSWLWTVFWPSSDYFPGEFKWRWAIDIASCRYGQLEIAILHGNLKQIANWVEAPQEFK
jgi:hypothetical protein